MFFSSLAAFTMSDEGSPEKFPFFRISAKKSSKDVIGSTNANKIRMAQRELELKHDLIVDASEAGSS
jgi:hypothetical protein